VALSALNAVRSNAHYIEKDVSSNQINSLKPVRVSTQTIEPIQGVSVRPSRCSYTVVVGTRSAIIRNDRPVVRIGVSKRSDMIWATLLVDRDFNVNLNQQSLPGQVVNPDKC
jgi:hypothetical protein